MAAKHATVPDITPDEIETELALCKKNIRKHQEEMANAFVRLGYAKTPDDVRLTVGPELECTEIAGYDSHRRRVEQITKEADKARRRGGHPTYNINDKKGEYMPPEAGVKALDKRFELPLTMYKTSQYWEAFAKEWAENDDHSNRSRQRFTRKFDKRMMEEHPEYFTRSTRTLVEPEPSFNTNAFAESVLVRSDHGYIMKPDLVAANQIEFSSSPRSAIGAAAWLNAMMNKAVHGAKDIGLKRIDFTALPHQETSPNSIHLNSVITVGGKNALSGKEWEGGKKGEPSDLALCIGKTHIDYLRHSLFMFARAESDYDRFAQEEVSGPSFIGMPVRKEHGKFASAMFRGEERQTERENSAYPDKKDKGPFRFELRVPCPGAAGHPNKEAYPEQELLAYEMMEAYTHMLLQGVKMWEKREKARKSGTNHIVPLHETQFRPERLHEDDPERTTLSPTKAQALQNFTKSKEVQNYWGEERIDLLQRLSERLDHINIADRNPHNTEKGPHVARVLHPRHRGALPDDDGPGNGGHRK